MPSLECSLLICKMKGPDGATSKPTRTSGSGAPGVNDALDCAVPRCRQEVGVQACYEAATQLLPPRILISFLPTRHGGLHERLQEPPPAFGKVNGAETLEAPSPGFWRTDPSRLFGDQAVADLARTGSWGLTFVPLVLRPALCCARIQNELARFTRSAGSRTG